MKYITLLFASICCLTTARSQVIVTAAGTGTYGFSGDGGPATSAKISSPYALAFDKEGSFYFSQDGDPRVRKVSSDGIITTFAGNGTSAYCCDGSPASSASVNFVCGIAVDLAGNVYLAEPASNRIRKVTTDGIIHTIAGTGVAGYNGDGILATTAQLTTPFSIAVDDTGSIYICDRDNYRIRKIDTFGYISTVVGTGAIGFTSDGASADTSAIDDSYCVALDLAGNILFKEKNRIRKVTKATGLLSTVAGNGVSGYSGDGGPATAASIYTSHFITDSVGNLYLGENSRNRIRKVNTEGDISTVVGTGIFGDNGEGVPALSANMTYPSGVAFSPAGELYIACKGDGKVRKITSHWASVDNVSGIDEPFQISPNPAKNSISLKIIGHTGKATISVVNSEGRNVETLSEQESTGNISIKAKWPPGIYTISAQVDGKIYTKLLTIE